MPIRDQQKVRPAAVAGRFYEGDALGLRRRMAETEAAQTMPRLLGAAVRGCVLPHAGYLFSLGVAMRTLGAARGGVWKRVVILGPSHYVGFRGLAAATFTSWRTPFGDLSTDVDALEGLEAAENPLLRVNDQAHGREHSLEVIFPMLQYFFGSPLVVPLVVGGITPDDARVVAALLAPLDGPETLWVISSDFTHYGRSFDYTPFGPSIDSASLRKLDGEGAELIARRDLAGFTDFLGRTGATICGAHAIAIYLALLELCDPARRVTGEIAAMADSGMVTGDYSCVVDYAGILFHR